MRVLRAKLTELVKSAECSRKSNPKARTRNQFILHLWTEARRTLACGYNKNLTFCLWLLEDDTCIDGLFFHFWHFSCWVVRRFTRSRRPLANLSCLAWIAHSSMDFAIARLDQR